MADKPKATDNATVADDATQLYRARMQLVGGLLNTAFESVIAPPEGRHHGAGPGGDDAVYRVGQGAYLHVMGQVFAVLFDLSQGLPVEQLTRLSRIVAEQRRAETSARKIQVAVGVVSARRSARGAVRSGPVSDDPASVAPQGDRRLPESFGAIVRELYGVSVTNGSADGRRPAGGDTGCDAAPDPTDPTVATDPTAPTDPTGPTDRNGRSR